MPRGRPRGKANAAGSKTTRFERIHQDAKKIFEHARLNRRPLEDLEAECYAEIATSSKGTNKVHTCRAILKLIEEVRRVGPSQTSLTNPAPNITSKERPLDRPLSKSEQIYADRFKYRLEMGESEEEAHIRAASEAQAYEMLIDLRQEQAEKGILDELRKDKKEKKSKTKETDWEDEDSS